MDEKSVSAGSSARLGSGPWWSVARRGGLASIKITDGHICCNRLFFILIQRIQMSPGVRIQISLVLGFWSHIFSSSVLVAQLFTMTTTRIDCARKSWPGLHPSSRRPATTLHKACYLGCLSSSTSEPRQNIPLARVYELFNLHWYHGWALFYQRHPRLVLINKPF